MTIESYVEGEALCDYFFIEGTIEVDSEYFINEIKKGINKKDNMNFKTNVRDHMTSYKYFNNDLKFKKILFKMHGLIAYEKNFLEELVSLKETKYSKLESIEQMKAIEYGFKIKTVELPEDFPSVNTESELEIVKNILANNSNQQELFNSIIKSFFIE